MKKLLAALAVAFTSLSATAAPATFLPAGGIYLKFTGQEQIAINGATTYAGTKEINWGVFVVTTLQDAVVNTPHDELDPGDDIFFVNKQGGGQITGMFYGIEAGTYSETNPFPATKGYMDLYWRDLDKMSATSVTGTANNVRCGYDCATGYTEGTFLARLFFDTGMDTGNSNNTIVGSLVPTSTKKFTGSADSYASVDMSKVGLWSEQLNSDYFTTGQGSRDLRFKNSYNDNKNWNSKTDANILGARVDDPGQAYALPEPGALSLMGLAMIGMGAALRRRSRK